MLKEGTTIKIDACIKSIGSVSVTIGSVKSIFPAYIIYEGIRTYRNKPGYEERVEVVELFVASEDERADDGSRIINRRKVIYNILEGPFFDYVLKHSNIPNIHHLCENWGDEYGLHINFVLANNTRYYVHSLEKDHISMSYVFQKPTKNKPFFGGKD